MHLHSQLFEMLAISEILKIVDWGNDYRNKQFILIPSTNNPFPSIKVLLEITSLSQNDYIWKNYL